ncbi:hypothetical protein B1A85_01125 [Chroococcidiopsis sp. TS-821]|nr:hypothetical protein B1A85_01125 [Chroococcidiopsis sp. TS-821]
MEIPYYAGELALQNRAGVQAEAASLRNIISATIKLAAKAFLQNQRFAIASTVDSNNVWASLLWVILHSIQIPVCYLLILNVAIHYNLQEKLASFGEKNVLSSSKLKALKKLLMLQIYGGSWQNTLHLIRYCN